MSTEVSTQLEQDAIKRMYERLIAARDKSKPFDDSITKDIEGSRMFQEAFCCTDPIYKEQVATIAATTPNIVIDDTVGSYLYGCFQPELTVEISCTPACANGIKNPNLTPCEIASYEKKGQLNKLNNVVSEDANIFIATGNTLTQEDLKSLFSQGVKVITIYKQDGNTINYILGESLNITQEDPTDSPPAYESTNGTGWVWMWIAIAIALLIIIMIILIFIKK